MLLSEQQSPQRAPLRPRGEAWSPGDLFTDGNVQDIQLAWLGLLLQHPIDRYRARRQPEGAKQDDLAASELQAARCRELQRLRRHVIRSSRPAAHYMVRGINEWSARVGPRRVAQGGRVAGAPTSTCGKAASRRARPPRGSRPRVGSRAQWSPGTNGCDQLAVAASGLRLGEANREYRRRGLASHPLGPPASTSQGCGHPRGEQPGAPRIESQSMSAWHPAARIFGTSSLSTGDKDVPGSQSVSSMQTYGGKPALLGWSTRLSWVLLRRSRHPRWALARIIVVAVVGRRAALRGSNTRPQSAIANSAQRCIAPLARVRAVGLPSMHALTRVFQGTR